VAQLAVVLLALFAQMERTYTIERAAHARAVATAKGRRVGRPVLVDRDKLEYAAHLRGAGRHDRGDRHENGDPAHQPVPASAAPPGAGGHCG
jgi:DNA invertase Pin-like site-specific DNA recombinase